jgi:flavin-dependent dehydrogenase
MLPSIEMRLYVSSVTTLYPKHARMDPVVIIGAGPAGSSAATVLAERGHDVIILEKEHFPRYSIGESLIPWCYFPLQRIGVLEQIQASDFTKKYSVQFVGRSGRASQPFYFWDHMNHDSSKTWQVSRGEFDSILVDNACKKGATVRFGHTVRGLLRDDDERVIGVKVEDPEGQIGGLRSSMVIDASGRAALSMSRSGWRMPDKTLKKVAIWTYFKGAMRDEGIDEGATTVAYVDKIGWFWYIPLGGDMVSVGVVGDKDYLFDETRDLQAVFDREVCKNQWIQDHLAVGTQCDDMHVTSDFSYRSKHCADDGLVLIGDAFAFLDPVFSSGMFFALHSGVLAGDAVADALEAGDVSAGRFAEYGEQFCAIIEAMRRLVYAFYNDSFSFGEFLKKHPDLRPALTDCLIGNLERDFGPLFTAFDEFMELPPPLAYGRPVQRELA